MKELLLGTSNPSKLAEMREYFAGTRVRCVFPAELHLSPEIPEDERTAAGNAMQKALAWHAASGLMVLTEDSGLVLLDLKRDDPEQPGVRVRRAPGHVMDDDEMLAYYAHLCARHGGCLRACYQNAWCLMRSPEDFALRADNEETMQRRAFHLTSKPCAARHPGWPLDSLSVCPQNGRYFAEMTDADFAAIEEWNDRAALIDWLKRQTCEA